MYVERSNVSNQVNEWYQASVCVCVCVEECERKQEQVAIPIHFSQRQQTCSA